MKRPVGVTMIAVLMCFWAGLVALFSLAFFVLGAPTVANAIGGPMPQFFSAMGPSGVGIFLAFAVVSVILAGYAFRLAYWAPFAIIIFIAVGSLFAVIGILAWLPHPENRVVGSLLLMIALDIWILYYLTNPDVKGAFAAEQYGPSTRDNARSQTRERNSSATLIQELTRQESVDLLARAHLGRLACSREDQPYIVPITFAYENNCLHSFSTVGQKLEWMRANPRVCVQVDEIVNPQEWVSVIVFGRFEELPDTPERQDARALCHDLLRRKAMWWEPGYVRTILGGAQRPLVPVFYRIHLVQITGHRAGLGVV